MKILLIGKNGQLGFELNRSLAVLGDVVSVGRSDCDLSHEASLRRLVQKHHPDVIVNAAAYTAVDRAEQDAALAMAINAHAPEILAQEAHSLDALLLHYSTDYVFDGCKQGAYIETDVPNPQSVYGLSKYLGEQAILRTHAKHLILRTSWVVGAHGANFAKTMLRLAAERPFLRVVNDQFGTPTSAALLADVSAHVLAQFQRHPLGFPFGLYHATARGYTHWHEYACFVLSRAHLHRRPLLALPQNVCAIPSVDYPTPAKRPQNSCLDTTHLRQTFGVHLPFWEDGVSHVLAQIFEK